MPLCALFICALWSLAGKGLTSWLSRVVSYCEFVTFYLFFLGQVWYLIVSIPDFCTLTYFGCEVLRLSLFCCALLCVLSSFAILLKRKRELVAFLLLSYRCLVTVNVM